MDVKFKKVIYAQLKGKQQENYNFQKVSSVLAEYGYSTIRLTADWQGADFIAQHCDGKTFLRVQLKSRISFSRKYEKKDLWLCFRDKNDVYLFPHDIMLKRMLKSGYMKGSASWEVKGGYTQGKLSKWMHPLLKEYKLASAV